MRSRIPNRGAGAENVLNDLEFASDGLFDRNRSGQVHESGAVGRVRFVALDERMAVELTPDGRAKDAGAAAVSTLIDAMTWRYLDLEMRAPAIIPISTWLRGS